jgi:hypothetical protein
MAFEPIQFRYRPPETLALAAAVPASQAATADTGLGPDGLPVAGRAARALMARLETLRDTARYLAVIIAERAGAVTVAVDPALHPEVLRALGRIYPGNPPPGISVPMYCHLVDAEMGMLRADMALAAAGGDSPYHVSPLARADVQTVINHFEDALTDRLDFLPQTVPLIRGLGGDQVIFEALRNAFAKYPGADGTLPGPAPGAAVTPILAASPAASGSAPVLAAALADPADTKADVSPALAAGTNQRLDVWGVYYAKTYDLVGGIDKVYTDIQSVNNRFITQPVMLLSKAVAMLTTLMALEHKPSLKSIRKSLVWLVLPRLMGEVGKFATLLDRLVQKAVSPALAVVNSLGRLFSEIARDVNQVAWLVDGGLTGSVRQQITGKRSRPQQQPAALKELAAVPHALGQVTAHLSWAINKTRSESTRVQRSMFRVMDRSLGGSGDRLETLQSMRALTALITISNSILTQLNMMTGGGLGAQPLAAGSQLGMIVDSVNQTGQQAIALSGDKIVLSAPKLTPPPPNVETQLVAGGSTEVNASQCFTVPVNPLTA